MVEGTPRKRTRRALSNPIARSPRPRAKGRSQLAHAQPQLPSVPAFLRKPSRPPTRVGRASFSAFGPAMPAADHSGRPLSSTAAAGEFPGKRTGKTMYSPGRSIHLLRIAESLEEPHARPFFDWVFLAEHRSLWQYVPPGVMPGNARTPVLCSYGGGACRNRQRRSFESALCQPVCL